MGPNGSGKSTLAKVLAGHPSYEVTAGEVIFDGKNLLEMTPDERAREGVSKLHDPNKAVILVTHYQRLLNYITPDFVHVLSAGRIVKEGGKELALELEEKGYDWLKGANGKSATVAPQAG